MAGELESIGGLKVVRLLGKGGMSEVYEAENTRLGSRHAVKVYAYPKDDEEVRRRFQTEGLLLARLSHPRIVRVTDMGEDAGRMYFVMDLVRNPDGVPQSLADVEEGSVDEETIGMWYDDIRDALAYIHAQGVVHRDLKLQNIMVGPDSHAVLMDFGISKAFEPGDGKASVISTVNTIVNLRDGRRPVMGSIGYMAPEIELGVAASPQSDWYALGVIVYKLLTGTWCDSRTDVVTTLETYDPVWKVIVPKLLHSNPEGRECLSYAAEKAAARERAEAEAEKRYLREKGRGHAARHVARYVGGVAIAAALAAGALGYRLAATHARLTEAERRLAIPRFEEIFAEPSVAERVDMSDAMMSQSSIELSQIDAWVATRGVFESLATDAITIGKAADIIAGMRRKLASDKADELWGPEYVSMGDDEVLLELFKLADRRLRRMAGEEKE